MPDAELIKLIKLKKQAAAEALFDQYSKLLSLAIFRITGDNKNTNITLEKTFVRIWLTIDQYNEQDKSLLAWLLAIAKELAHELTAAEILKINPGQTVLNSENLRLA